MSGQGWEPLIYPECIFLLRMGCPPPQLLGHFLSWTSLGCPWHVVIQPPPLLAHLSWPAHLALGTLLHPVLWEPISREVLSRYGEVQVTCLTLRLPADFTLSTPLGGPQVTTGSRHLCLSVTQRVENCARRWKLTWAQRTKRSNYSITSKYTWSFPISK